MLPELTDENFDRVTPEAMRCFLREHGGTLRPEMVAPLIEYWEGPWRGFIDIPTAAARYMTRIYRQDVSNFIHHFGARILLTVLLTDPETDKQSEMICMTVEEFAAWLFKYDDTNKCRVPWAEAAEMHKNSYREIARGLAQSTESNLGMRRNDVSLYGLANKP